MVLYEYLKYSEREIYMKDTITQYQFVDEMSKEQHGFSRLGAFALFDYLTEYEER